ncbi:MAG: protein phosphatase 2C domain-containing protein [Deltaproteobacteria bacterium]|jgi:serine/threonine protein phosphatase PrpC|nr:protein phosphatase 2C domain-containing protein [Deltaproteobacteria bacterium]
MPETVAPPPILDPNWQAITTNFFENFREFKNPAILFQLEANSGLTKLYNRLDDMIRRMPDIAGKYDKEMEYKADTGIDGIFRIAEVWTNGFFRQEKNGSPGKSPSQTEDGEAPLLTLTGDRLGIRIKGLWKSYDGQISLLFLMGTNQDRKFVRFEKEYFIAPDPKTLWKNLPVAEDFGYPIKDDDSKFLKISGGELLVVAASRRGRSHANVAKPRDDNFKMLTNPVSGWTAVAVADGAGSARFSRKGSELACETAVDTFLAHAADWNENEEKLENLRALTGNDVSLRCTDPRFAGSDEGKNAKGFAGFVHDAAIKAYYAIDAAVRERKKSGNDGDRPADVRDYHTTLIFAAFKKFDTGYVILSFWIGDGGLALYNPDGTGDVKVLGIPDSGEFAGQTRFLTMAEELKEKALNRVWLSFPEDFEALILASDGVTDPFFPSEDKIRSREQWKQFWEVDLNTGTAENPGCPELFDGSPPEVKSDKLLDWLNYWVVGEHDDRTLLVVKKYPDSRPVRRKKHLVESSASLPEVNHPDTSGTDPASQEQPPRPPDGPAVHPKSGQDTGGTDPTSQEEPPRPPDEPAVQPKSGQDTDEIYPASQEKLPRPPDGPAIQPKPGQDTGGTDPISQEEPPRQPDGPAEQPKPGQDTNGNDPAYPAQHSLTESGASVPPEHGTTEAGTGPSARGHPPLTGDGAPVQPEPARDTGGTGPASRGRHQLTEAGPSPMSASPPQTRSPARAGSPAHELSESALPSQDGPARPDGAGGRNPGGEPES